MGMIVNVIGDRKCWPGNPGLLEDEKVHFLDLLSLRQASIQNPLALYRFFRSAKKCMILYWAVDAQSERVFGKRPLSLLLSVIRLIIKKPGGPTIVVQDAEVTSPYQKLADIFVRDGQNHTEVMKQAYFKADCGHPASIYTEPMQKERIEWLKKNIRGKTLEIGCSTGFVLNYIGGHVGVDIDPMRLEYAQLRYPDKKFLKVDAANMPFADGEFDTVVIPDILEHVELAHAKKIVAEALRVSRRLMITVPNASKPNYDRALVENPEHRWFPTPEIMREMMGAAAQILFSPGNDFIYVIHERTGGAPQATDSTAVKK